MPESILIIRRNSVGVPRCEGPEVMRDRAEWDRRLDVLNRDNRDMTRPAVPYVITDEGDPKRLRYCETCEKYLPPRAKHRCPAGMTPKPGLVLELRETQKCYTGPDMSMSDDRWQDASSDPANWTTFVRVTRIEVTEIVNPSKDPYWPNGGEDCEIVFYTETRVSGWNRPWTHHDQQKQRAGTYEGTNGKTYEGNSRLDRWKAEYGELRVVSS